jgi:diguanylate cyclase (GGDEF)-like protein
MWTSFRKLILMQPALLVITLIVSHNASCESLILDNKQSYDLAGYMEILSDPTNQLTVQQAEDQKDWTKTIRGQTPNLGFTQASIWIRFLVTSPADTSRKFYISFEYPVTHSVTFFIKDQHGVFQEEHTGSGIPASANIVPNRHFVFPFMIGHGEAKMIYLRVQSEARMTLPVRVLSDQSLFQKAIRDYTVYGALFGLLVLVMLYFIAVGSFLYKGTPTWLALYSIFFGLHTAIRGGFVRLILPDALLGVSNLLQLLVIAGLFFTGAKFFRLFLSLKSHSVTLDRIMTFFQYLSLTFILLPMLPTPIIIGVSFLLIVINPLFSISLAFYFWRKGVSNAGLFAVGWTVAHFVAVYDFFRINGLIPYQPLGEWPIPFSLFIALIFLSIALIRQNTVYHRMAETDPLTLLANRRKFDDSLKEEWNRCYRMGSPLSLIMADVDHFKEYNDAYGHKAGDLYLCRIAKILESHTRRIGDLAVRYGGEEFILLLPHMDAASAFSLAETIRYSVCHMDKRSDCEMTISMGIATTIPTKGGKPENLILEADAAMYEAKRAGRNRTIASRSVMI